MTEPDSPDEVVEAHHLFHRSKSEDQSGYLLNGVHGLKAAINGYYRGVHSEPTPYEHVIGYIENKLERTSRELAGPLVAVDIGAAHNAVLRELVQTYPQIEAHAIALGDPRTGDEREADEKLGIEYLVGPAEKTLNTLPKADLLFCWGTLQHIPQPANLIKRIYESCKDGAEIYFDWNGIGQTSQVEWENGTYQDFIAELRQRGIEISHSKLFDHMYFYIKVNQVKFPDDFYSSSTNTSTTYRAPLGIETPAVKSIITLHPDKMVSRQSQQLDD